MPKVAIIGGGRGGTALLDILKNDKTVEVIGVVDKDPKARVLGLAKRLKIPVLKDYKSLLNRKADVDLIINVTGSDKVSVDLEKLKPAKAEVIGGLSAKFVWDLIEQRRLARKEIEKRLYEQQSLYDLGLKLTQSQKLQEIFTEIVSRALELTKSPAGSLVIYDEASGEMYFGAAKGFSDRFIKGQVWRIRKGGLTELILNSDEPVVISDATANKSLNNPLFLKENIKSLVAVPLKAEGKIQGVLYIDDFKIRHFSQSELSILSLLSNMAALAIQRAKLLESTKQMAITDELTRLYNLRHFLNRLDQEIKRAKRYLRPLSLAMIDIDFFKKYNDKFGHQEGNKLLKKIALVLEKESREGDIVARYGGEEFSIIMPETSNQKAKKFAERLRKKIETALCKEKFDNCITISLGLANYPQDAEISSVLLEKADEALYQAKRDGRNCVRVCNSVKQLELY